MFSKSMLEELKKNIIICIYGGYGVGKDLFSDIILQEFEEKGMDVKKIKSYTTRKPRYEGEDTHTFISKEEWDKLTNFVATSKIGDKYYGATLDQFDAKYNIYVINEEGLKQMLENKKKCPKMGHIFVIKMTRPKHLINVDKVRLEREEKNFSDLECHFELENDGTIDDLRAVANYIIKLIPFYQLF